MKPLDLLDLVLRHVASKRDLRGGGGGAKVTSACQQSEGWISYREVVSEGQELPSLICQVVDQLGILTVLAHQGFLCVCVCVWMTSNAGGNLSRTGNRVYLGGEGGARGGICPSNVLSPQDLFHSPLDLLRLLDFQSFRN